MWQALLKKSIAKLSLLTIVISLLGLNINATYAAQAASAQNPTNAYSNNYSTSTSTITSTSTSSSSAQSEQIKSRLYLNINKDNLYFPTDYQAGRNFEVIITGYLPNLCYQEVFPKITFTDKQVIKLSLWSHVTTSVDGKKIFCAQLVRPFLQKINLGKLEEGQYLLQINDETGYKVDVNLEIKNGHVSTY